MADFEYTPCPKCKGKFMLGTEFFRIPNAYAHCPYCGTEFKVGVAAKAEAEKESNPR
jgi:PHP family Zn ribbon phosphoesterase